MSNGRYEVVDQPLALPGACYLTGSAGAASGPYIDPKQSIRGYGAVYFSAQAVEEMYRELKAYQGIDITKSLSEQETVASYTEGYEVGYRNAKRELEEFYKETILNDLARVVANRSAGLDPFAAPVDESEDFPEDAGKSEGGEPGEVGGKSGSDGTSESTATTSSGKGRGRVSGSAVDDSDAILGGLEL